MEVKEAYQLPMRRQAKMQFRHGGYTMLAGSVIRGSHDFLPGIVLTGRFATSSRDGMALTFGDDGFWRRHARCCSTWRGIRNRHASSS